MKDAKSKHLAMIFEAEELIGRKEYKKALKKLNIVLAMTKDIGLKGCAYYYMGKLHNDIQNPVRALFFLLKSVKLLEEVKSSFADKFIYNVYETISGNCQSLGMRKEAFYYAGLAFVECKDMRRKSMMLSNYIYDLVASNSSPKVMLQEFSRINDTMLPAIVAEKCIDLPPEPVAPADKVHIAYISPDYRKHVMYEFYYAMLQYHNRDKFFISCIYTGNVEDEMTKWVRGKADRFVELPNMTFNELAARLRAMKIDIAVDLAGYTGHSGLYSFCYRVAPVQVSGLGWMESTGMKEVDYLITDRYMDEPGENHIVEKPLYLPTCFCFTPHEGKKNTAASQGAPCRNNGYITFGSFNRLIKITDEMLMAWREIMKRVPNAKLLMKSNSYNQEATREYTLDRMEKLGMDRQRIILEEPSKEYMERYLDVDIALDTYPYCGGGTTCDALYMGVPVVSLYGKRRSSNFGRSILSAAGLGELAVNNADEYVNIAVSLANDWDTLDMLHKNLRSMLQKSDLMNGEKYTRELEAQYEEILKH